MEELITLLRQKNYSCVIRNNGIIHSFSHPGVKDLHHLLTHNPDFLDGAQVADKVVGKVAASLMILGEISELYAELISTPALQLLQNHDIKVSFGEEVPIVLNRDQSGWCPLEMLSYEENNPQNILLLLEEFMKRMVRN